MSANCQKPASIFAAASIVFREEIRCFGFFHQRYCFENSEAKNSIDFKQIFTKQS